MESVAPPTRQRELSILQKRFIEAILGPANGNATKAAAMAGYASENNAALRVSAAYNMRHPKIRKILDGRMGEGLCRVVRSRRIRPSVYFVQAIAGGPIKIGMARDVVSRLNHLQVASPVKLALLGTIPGGRAVERRLHEKFSANRLHGEWFTPTRELLEYVRRVTGKQACGQET